MTCVAGLACDGKVWMAADSAGVSEFSLAVRADAKLFRNVPYLIVFTSSFRMGQILRYADLPEPPRNPSNLSRFLCVEFVDAIRDRLKAAGFATKDKEAEMGGTFLVAVTGRLFRVEADYQICENVDSFDAVGCGMDLALGSLFSTEGRPPEERLRIAVAAAERFNAGVRGPVHVMMTEAV